MDTAFAQALATDQFLHRLGILIRASCSVIMVRTREPLRCAQALDAFARANGRGIRIWSLTSGWSERYVERPSAPEKADGISDPFLALREVGRDDTDVQLWVMIHPHVFIPKHPGMMQLVKEYACDFPSRSKTLVLVVPLGFAPPQEIEDDVHILDFAVPSHAELRQSFELVLASVPEESRRPRYGADQIARVLAAGAGMTAAEFEAAVAKALAEHRKLLPALPVEAVVQSVLAAKTEVVKRSEVLELVPSESMDSVGGLANLKTWIAKRRRCFSDEARRFGIDPPKGIALIGPPGTGKSLAAKAIASEFGLPLVRFDVSRVFNSLVGQSEARVRAALKMIESMAPVVVMVDEVDKVFQVHSGVNDSGVSTRVLGAILTEMQEQKAPIFWVATANRTRNLPSEFLRRGRLDEVFAVSVPDRDERLEVLRIHLRKRGWDPDTVTGLERAAELSEGFVPAELESAVKDALVEAFATGSPLTGETIVQSLATMVPLSEAFREDFLAMEQWAAQNARPAGGKPGAAPRRRLVQRPQGRTLGLQ